MDSEDDLDQLDYSGQSLDDLTNLFEYNDSFIPSSEVGVEYLSNVDYSLNSPLIRDEMEEFVKFLKGLPSRKSWNVNIWNKRRQAIKKVNFNLQNLIEPTEFHKWFGQKNLETKFDITQFEQLMSISQKDSDETFVIVKQFLTNWIQKDIINPNKSNCSVKILKWGAYFLDFYVMTLILNVINERELDELMENFKIKKVSEDCHNSFVFYSKNFGRVLISYGFAIFLDEFVILDRNTLLMCKDTYIARFQTLFSMINRVDTTFKNDDWEIINNIYKLGDVLLSQAGNRSYDGIKMIEPICSLRMSQLAHQYRPLIPMSMEFYNHIQNSLEELDQENIDIRQIYNSIIQLENPDLVLTIFGSFRHWGHPYLEYLEGLEKVHEQVNLPKEIDDEYAETLGSDLAYIVLLSKFNETKKWFVNLAQLDSKHPFYNHVKNNTWPTPKQIEDFGFKWHKLPLIQCFEIPDVIDPSLIYSDKSHSMNRSEILNHVRNKYDSPIPSRKVLKTFLNTPATNWKEFLKTIDEDGLTLEDLVIGLKGKEREIKLKGRFFTLMSWKLREYFVVTEYLIKSFFVPLFHGLTMADDLNTVIKKLMDNSSGQGSDNYENICIANHIDYTKWNNHQRHKANEPVFTVMGKFLGYPNLISRTHQFFQQSLIYYNGRPDLMTVSGNTLENKGNYRVVWNGQDGGLEGLRQKGWSVVNLLVIRRESLNRNTRVKILAQGDNQVICTQYKVQKTRTQDELVRELRRIVDNNNEIMKSIEDGTKKLGLIINQDESLQATDFLIYGKVPIFRGNIKGLETKRWSRVTCVTNDQLPTLANTLSTICSNALTVAHFSTSPLNSIVHYNFLGNFGRNLLDLHNPALRCPTYKKIKNKKLLETLEYKIGVLYLDPCLGGACGMSLTRFLIRNFPDPLTESLTFWKSLEHNAPGWLKQLIAKVGNPKLGINNLQAFKKLIEDPLSINIPGGVNPLTMIKEEIKKNLILRSREIKNHLIRSSINYFSDQENKMVEYLKSIKPLFPRFLSEYMSGTYIGIIKSLINLFQNSKTIRNVFSRKMEKTIQDIIVKSEIQTIESLCSLHHPSPYLTVWSCSSTQADKLRQFSWGCRVYGATIPHPLEMLNNVIKQEGFCTGCESAEPYSYFISTLVPKGLLNYKVSRGPYKAYLGSKTSESTSILQPWEKETKVPLLRRASKLRNAIGWFIDKESNLGRSILQNLEALTGEDWSQQTEGFKRTGSALHRFSCSRQSAAGYSAQSPAKLTWMCSTTDTLSTLNTVNHDFMHQALLIFAQATISELMDNTITQGYYHSHISCKECLRELEEIRLDTEVEFSHKDVSEQLSKWKPDSTKWAEKKKVKKLKLGKWSNLKSNEQSFHVGRAEGFLFSDLTLSGNFHANDSSLFPLSIQYKIIPRTYLKGILEGLIRGSALHCISRRNISELKRPREALLGIGLHLIDLICKNNCFLTLCRSPHFENLFYEVPHKIPASYPLSNSDLSLLTRNYLRSLFQTDYMNAKQRFKLSNKLWIFADINEHSLIGLFLLSGKIANLLYGNQLDKHAREKIRSYKNDVIFFKDPFTKLEEPILELKQVRRVESEIRHACKDIIIYDTEGHRNVDSWGSELTVDIYATDVIFSENSLVIPPELLQVKRIQNPLISGMRLFQFATGSHYKLRSIIQNSNINFCDALVGADGSGGITSMLLRINPHSRVIFNSLLNLDNVDLRGTAPSPPSAVYAIPEHRSRCVNLMNCWQYPNNLAQVETWNYFYSLKNGHFLDIDLIIFDLESSNIDEINQVEKNLSDFIFPLLSDYGTLIYKTYLTHLFNNKIDLFLRICSQFVSIQIITTEITSSQSSEVYIVCKNKKHHNLSHYPDFFSILNNLLKLPCYLTAEEDFGRAKRLKSLDMFTGVPKTFIPDKYIQLSLCLKSLSVETGVAALITELIKECPDEYIHVMPFTTFFLALNSILHMTSFYLKRPNILSDSKVYNLGILITGFFNWCSLALDNSKYHALSQRYILEHFPLSWKINSITRKNKNLKLYRYNYSFKGDYKNSKNFYLDAKMSQIGTILRCWTHMFGYNGYNLNLKLIESFLTKFNKNLTIKTIKQTTDILKIIQNPTMGLKGSSSSVTFPINNCFLNSATFNS